ncbi:MAG TPA: response regulator transcription factor [Thermoleophilaceae bacterium]
MTGLRAAELWGLPEPRTESYTLAVVSGDESFADRAVESLEREGLQVRLLATGTDAETLDGLSRRPTLVVVRCPQDRRSLDRTLRRVERRAPGAIVVVVIADGEHVDLGLTLANGADALVRDEDLGDALGPAVRAAACGQCSAPAGLLRATQPPALSLRERQVLGLALAGLSNAQIADRLYLAPSTVKTHISSAFRRLGVHSRREATALVFGSDDALQRTVRATLGLAEEYAGKDEP